MNDATILARTTERRPRTWLSRMLPVVGLKSFYSLPILEYRKTQNAVVTITMVYYGTDPQTVARRNGS